MPLDDTCLSVVCKHLETKQLLLWKLIDYSLVLQFASCHLAINLSDFCYYSVLMVFFMQERYRVNYGVWLVTPISIDTDWSPIVRGTSGITLLI